MSQETQEELARRMVAEIIAEERLVEDFKKAEAEYHRLGKAIMDLFVPMARRALEAKDETLLQAYLDECPDSVCKCFIADMIRQLRTSP